VVGTGDTHAPTGPTSDLQFSIPASPDFMQSDPKKPIAAWWAQLAVAMTARHIP
jgi:hypothetical protein